MQSKILRVLQQDEILRVGGAKPIPVNVRIIAASNQPLEKLVSEGHFRLDLYYRLGIVIIKIPSLHERREDIPILLYHLLRDICKKNGKPIPKIDSELLESLLTYDWPGNVRELQNYIERAVVLSRDSVLTTKHFPEKITKTKPVATDTLNPLELQEKETIEKTLRLYNGNIYKTSQKLGVSRNTLYSRLKLYDISF
ncbi:sigma-54-dependent Fis family transcriptional regulator [Desulfosporosinus fructosivorans]|uniref:Sigma-54-dependent Fis family transcriptional regulator n=1 Tax=Desulfosporosinus fructosivorans TaxID=2018669 RepID=A0A4Z0QZI9_9FIRM|nr:sigma-54-dependent Fis family transcriptional regulator [Desulfosporosinus fructosivorans]